MEKRDSNILLITDFYVLYNKKRPPRPLNVNESNCLYYIGLVHQNKNELELQIKDDTYIHIYIT